MANLRLHALNDVKLVGRLTRDPELRFTPQGIPVARFRVAASRRYRDKNGDWKEDTAFVPCTVWRETAERVGQRLKKGSPVFVEGRLRTKEWETKEGQKRSDLELDVLRVQFLESMGEGTFNPETEPVGEAAPARESVGVGAPVVAAEADPTADEDGVPF